jgi:hypothetical protein
MRGKTLQDCIALSALCLFLGCGPNQVVKRSEYLQAARDVFPRVIEINRMIEASIAQTNTNLNEVTSTLEGEFDMPSVIVRTRNLASHHVPWQAAIPDPFPRSEDYRPLLKLDEQLIEKEEYDVVVRANVHHLVLAKEMSTVSFDVLNSPQGGKKMKEMAKKSDFFRRRIGLPSAYLGSSGSDQWSLFDPAEIRSVVVIHAGEFGSGEVYTDGVVVKAATVSIWVIEWPANKVVARKSFTSSPPNSKRLGHYSPAESIALNAGETWLKERCRQSVSFLMPPSWSF